VRIFIYEFVCGGGLYSIPETPAPSLLAEGRAMLTALVQDFCALDDGGVVATADLRLSLKLPDKVDSCPVTSSAQERKTFLEAAKSADCAIIIAPEFDGILLERLRWAQEAGTPIISPKLEFAELAMDKQRTAEVLHEAQVPVPSGRIVTAGKLPEDFPYPAVAKPNDGAGSIGVRYVKDGNTKIARGTFRLESCVPGEPVSVGTLSNGSDFLPLPSCRQHLAGDGTFAYLGGSLPLAAPLDRRARELAERAISAMPPTLGYAGVDLVLGDAEDGSGDAVIEVNPRLTTSYIGYRHASRGNLARAIVDAMTGKLASVDFDLAPVSFRADGTVD